MSKRIRAAGAVTLAKRGETTETLLVHRAAYDDWSFPKGKAIPDELRPVTAVREVREETGVLIDLGIRLGSTRYPVGKEEKTVDWWRARPRDRFYHLPDKEVDEVRWVPVDEARQILSYHDEVELLDEALSLPPTTPLLLVRHGKAMLRKHWSGNDQTRHLVARGRRQAKELIPLFEAFGVARLVSSPATRCAQTLAPYGRYTRIPTETIELLTEEQGTKDPDGVVTCVRELAHTLTKPMALCGHRPVLPSMHEGLDMEPRSMLVGETTVLHRDKQGRNVVVEHHKPTA